MSAVIHGAPNRFGITVTPITGMLATSIANATAAAICRSVVRSILSAVVIAESGMTLAPGARAINIRGDRLRIDGKGIVLADLMAVGAQ